MRLRFSFLPFDSPSAPIIVFRPVDMAKEKQTSIREKRTKHLAEEI